MIDILDGKEGGSKSIMRYMVMCYEGNQPAQPYFELIRNGGEKYTFSLSQAQEIAKDLKTQYGVFGDTYVVVKWEIVE